MTAPITPVTKPTKTVIATIGAVLSVVVPLVTSLLTYLPSEWSAVITGVIGLLTVLGVYVVPNKPTGAVVVSESTPIRELPTGTPLSEVVDPSSYRNPWK